MIFKGKECKTQAANLGTTFKSPADCFAKAMSVVACKHGNIMWAPAYNSEWGCRCCAVTGGSTDSKNNTWDIYGPGSTTMHVVHTCNLWTQLCEHNRCIYKNIH